MDEQLINDGGQDPVDTKTGSSKVEIPVAATPKPNPARVSKSVSVLVGLLVVGILAAIGYGMNKRSHNAVVEKRQAADQSVSGAGPEGAAQVTAAIPKGTIGPAHSIGELGASAQTPDPTGKTATDVGNDALKAVMVPLGPDGKPLPAAQQQQAACPPGVYPGANGSGCAQQPTGFAQPGFGQASFSSATPVETAGQKARRLAQEEELAARNADTNAKAADAVTPLTGGAGGVPATGADPNKVPSSQDALADIAKISGMVGAGQTPEQAVQGMSPEEIERIAHKLGYVKAGAAGGGSGVIGAGATGGGEASPQDEHEQFLRSAATPKGDYLTAIQNGAMGAYELKAGWDIPARMEHATNSDLPGDVRALVTANVYDSATGKYLLIPQGARLVGHYDSRVSYGQSAVQIAWDRVIFPPSQGFPNGSTLDLEGMQGVDGAGQTGIGGKVDRHYKRLVGFAALTTVMGVGISIATSRNGSSLYSQPSWQEGASLGASQGLQQVSNQLLQRNINVQPTIKIPLGSRLNVRVNRDISFLTPFVPLALAR